MNSFKLVINCHSFYHTHTNTHEHPVYMNRNRILYLSLQYSPSFYFKSQGNSDQRISVTIPVMWHCKQYIYCLLKSSFHISRDTSNNKSPLRLKATFTNHKVIKTKCVLFQWVFFLATRILKPFILKYKKLFCKVSPIYYM